MKAIELPTVYDPKSFEDRLYKYWLDNSLFAPDLKIKGQPYVIVIPPPNVTGVLHMGHGLNNSLQDVLIRYHRMSGQATLWLPGSDHAGIATQAVVEKQLRKRGTSKEKVGRERFVEETWKVTNKHHDIIVQQLQKIGSSCDWQRERFTLDEGLSRAVREVFVSLFEKGLVYKGNYLVNWCWSCGTAISDDEVEHEEIQGRMYHYRYPLADGSGAIEIATTRPETMLGDTALAVHPDDKRYKHLVGKQAQLPLTERNLPIVADTYVDMEFGSGVVKVTPAHDANDYEIGKRHNLPRINILNPDNTLNSNVPESYRGLRVLEARKKVVEDIKKADLFIRDEKHVHTVGHCYRCHSVIEPYLSDQWFVRMRPLAEKALKAWDKGEVQFFPKKWENTYAHWLRNIRDWCISRQLWWGHRIPVWYCDSCGEMTVSREDPAACQHCSSTEIHQDPDVLDTWFSSALWPFSTLGWPEQTEDLQRFYPTSTLITAYEIIFFWVARMIMMGLEFMGKVPFADVYIHGLVRDTQGRKMSKSLGNGVDPLEVVDEYGADALRFTLAFLAAQGQDILMDKESFKLGSKFANKIWNASRFILMNLEGRNLVGDAAKKLDDVDRWIVHRLNQAARSARSALDQYRFNDASQAVYEYFWNDFCDWYIEAAKLVLEGEDEAEKDRKVTLCLTILEESLRLLHPFLPFLTEEIYQKLPQHGLSIVTAPYPKFVDERVDHEAQANFTLVQELVRAVRTLRSEFTIPTGTKIPVTVKTTEDGPSWSVFYDQKGLIALLIGSGDFQITAEKVDRHGSIPVVGSGFEAFVYIKAAIDLEREIEKLKKELRNLEDALRRTAAKLANPSFLSKAPEEVVLKEKSKQEELQRRKGKIAGYIEELST
ncbi:MAG: valine--tRNA ligase [Spirochaetaceae bacterium]|nr:MAG: valine--tRNA ligase [Spirochaetaceae bacterium]